MLQKSQLVIELLLLVLGRILLVLAEWQRMSGLLLRDRLSACKIIQTIRCSSTLLR